MNTSWAGGAPRKRADATSIFVAHSLSFCGEVLRRGSGSVPCGFAFEFGCARFL
jgi:hypothetical protein